MSTDTKWLSWLKYQFTEAMIKSNRFNNNELHVTLNDFLENFNFKEPFLAHRLFNYLDRDKSGTLSLCEFINGLEVVVNGTQEQKMEFLFKVFDVDNDGHMDYSEMRMMLKCCLENSPSLDMEETVDDLAAALFKDTDKDESGDISIEELKSAFKRHESLFNTLSVSTSIWIKPKFINKTSKRTWYSKIKDSVVNNRAHFVFWSVYTFVHFLCALVAFVSYMDKSIFVIFARICGNSLNFNCSLILVLVLRKHFTWLRSKGGCSFIPIDDFIAIHKKIGIIILVEALIHTIAHFINLYFVCIQTRYNYWNALFTWELNLGYPTGIIELVLLFIILIFAMSFVRNRGYFQLFYWFHSLTIPWLIIMLFHGKAFWRWILLPGFCYLIEKVLRYRKVSSNKYGDTYITEAFVLPSKVTHLVIRKPSKFHFKPGDYVFLNVPAVAKYEWHPFSISSAPENSDHIWLHIKACGNWTKKLYSFSSSAKFDVSTSFSSQRSHSRMNMRARMSKVYPDDSLLKRNQIDGEHLNTICAAGGCRKIVSFDRIAKINEANARDAAEPTQQQQAINSDNASLNNNQMQVAPRHKGILKVMALNGQGSFNGNETFSNSVVQGNDFVESTPKFIENKTGVDEKDNINLLNEENNHQNVSLQKLAETDVHSESHNKPKLALTKLSSQFKSIDLNEQNTSNLNIANEYFSNKDKVTRKNSLENQLTDHQIVFSIDSGASKKQDNVVITLNSNNNSICSGEDRKFLGNYKNTKETNKKDDKDDILGYLKMYQKANRVNMETIGLDQIWRLKVLIDGPYGTPSQDIFDAEHAVLVAAGIGITPFASILQSLMHKYKRAKATCPCCSYKLGENMLYNEEKLAVKKVDFIWVTREQRSLEWFISMLSQMEIEQRKNNDMFLETHLYVTSAKRQSDLRSIGLHLTLDAVFSQEESSLIDGLRQRTHYGRPNWDIVMQNLIRKQKGKVEVFYCGLPSLAILLQNKCQEYGLVFKKEIF